MDPYKSLELDQRDSLAPSDSNMIIQPSSTTPSAGSQVIERINRVLVRNSLICDMMNEDDPMDIEDVITEVDNMLEEMDFSKCPALLFNNPTDNEKLRVLKCIEEAINALYDGVTLEQVLEDIELQTF